ncbi:hypothetical protein JCM3765_005263 [Sporobolomyces pararoseus]
MVHSVPSSPTLSPSSTSASTSPTSLPNGDSNVTTEVFSIESLEKEELIQLVEKLKSSYESLEERFNKNLESNELHVEDEVNEDGIREKEKEESEEKIRDLERELNDVRERESEIRRDQERMEEELAGRIEVLEKLRASVRELERDKRETLKRYREQSDSFDSERQSWYDQEQHYKSRIQNLSTQRKSNKSLTNVITPEEEHQSLENSEEPLVESETITPTTTNAFSPPRSPAPTSASAPTPLELSLQSQLDTLQTAHSSLSTSLRTLQTEMTDLKRVYKDLQEENESYEILLGEKTLSGEVTGTDFFRKSFSWGEGGTLDGGGGGGVDGRNGNAWTGFGFQGGLEAVGEEDGDLDVEEDDEESESESESEEEGEEEDIEKILLESKGTGSIGSGAVSAQSSTTKRRSSRRSRSIALAHAKRHSTSFVPSLSGGLDLAAELEAAQKEEELDEVEIEKKREKEERRNRKREERENKKREATAARRDGSQSMPVGLEELHLEIKQLREANKALTLYVSKIVDRVCSQEGFEKVLAVDYRTNNTTPKADNNSSSPKHSQPEEPAPSEPPATTKKPRPVSTSFFSRASVSPGPTTKEPSTPKTAGPSSTGLAQTPSSASSVGSTTTTTTNGPRRSGGLTWDGISSVFGFGSSSAPSATQSPSISSSLSRSTTTTLSNGIKPLMLSTPEGARRLSISDEDEDDMIERERLRVDMSRHGIDYAPTLAQIGRPRSSSSATSPTDGVSPASLSPLPPPSNLDPIEEAERQLRAQEKEEETIRQQIVKEGRGSGLTEAPQRRMNKLERRHSSRASSISFNLSPSSSSTAINGLGIDSPSPVATSGSVSPANIAEEPEKGGETEEEGQKWTKALRRMSRGWTSPPVS